VESFKQMALVDPINPNVTDVLKTLEKEVEQQYAFHKMSKIEFSLQDSCRELKRLGSIVDMTIDLDNDSEELSPIEKNIFYECE